MISSKKSYKDIASIMSICDSGFGRKLFAHNGVAHHVSKINTHYAPLGSCSNLETIERILWILFLDALAQTARHYSIATVQRFVESVFLVQLFWRQASGKPLVIKYNA